MRKKDKSSEVNVRATISLYHQAKVGMGSKLYEQFLGASWCMMRLVLLLLVFAMVVDVITEYARDVLMIVILFADDWVLVSESMQNLRRKFLKLKEAFGSK